MIQIGAASILRWAEYPQHLAEHTGFSIFTQIVTKTSDTEGSCQSDSKQSPCHSHSENVDLKFTHRSSASPFIPTAAPGALDLAFKASTESRGEIREAGSLVPASHFIHILQISFGLFFFISF